MPGFPVHHQLTELTQPHVHHVSDAIQPSYTLLSPSSPALNLSQHQGLFQWVSSSPQVAKMLEFHFQHQSFQLIFRIISFRMGWFDLLAVQGTLKSLLQHHSSKASILWCSAFFIVQHSHPYMTIGKAIAFTRLKFVGKVMSLLFHILSSLVIAFLPKSKCLLISWLQSPSAMILEPKKVKSVTVSIVFPSICHEVMGPDAMILVFWMLSFKPTFSLFSFTFIKRLCSSSLLSAIRPTLLRSKQDFHYLLTECVWQVTSSYYISIVSLKNGNTNRNYVIGLFYFNAYKILLGTYQFLRKPDSHNSLKFFFFYSNCIR